MGKIIFQNFKINIPTDDTEFSPTGLKFDQRSGNILAFGIFSKRIDQVDLRGIFKMEIDGKEIFPDDTDTKMFSTNASVPVEKKMYKFSEPIEAGNLELRLKYKSTNNALTPFVAHDVTYTFMIETKDKI